MPTHRLRKSLLFLEGPGMITRVSGEASAEVVVTDRARLVDCAGDGTSSNSASTNLAP
ncbi:hypothetical protein LFM09_43810 [Lentzea alba]|uniref:hypothetical protein n=1 Tax=Lentzea alba TaxID=2714351 RepID=UPI0039BFAC2F